MKSHTPTVLVISGITGDLVRRKLLPALFELSQADALPDTFRLIGITRQKKTAEDILSGLVPDDATDRDMAFGGWLRDVFDVVTMDIGKEGDFKPLHDKLQLIGADDTWARLHYLAVPPAIFGRIVINLAGAGFSTPADRLLIEKPFGFDYDSAEELVETLQAHYDEKQLYRIDHYLAKDTTQNILAFRFLNPVFAAVWNRNSIQSITITAAEKIGIEGRADFYEQTGALRDFVQNHLMQLLTAVTMERPADQSADSLHTARADLMAAIPDIPRADVARLSRRGRYEGYLQEVGNHHSLTETFAALRLTIENDRWHGVPMTLVSGKSLASKYSTVEIVFRAEGDDEHANRLVFTVSGDEGVDVELLVKKPGLAFDVQPVMLSYDYDSSFADAIPDAYAKVLLDGINGDRSLFPSSDEIMHGWRIVRHVVEHWQNTADDLTTYRSGARTEDLLKDF